MGAVACGWPRLAAVGRGYPRLPAVACGRLRILAHVPSADLSENVVGFTQIYSDLVRDGRMVWVKLHGKWQDGKWPNGNMAEMVTNGTLLR
jgi:hypothetical protein